MARMIPPYINPEVRSGAERRIYKAISDSNSLDNFVCLHSLGLSRHLWKRQGEIDFVLVGENVILCLEVKGGRIKRKDGVWYFTDRYGQETKKAEGPFAQASSAMYSLKSNLESRFGHTGFVFGYGVVMPDIRFEVDSPEWDQEIVYDLGTASRPFKQYIQKLLNYWRQKGTNLSPHISVTEIVKYLRGDFELSTPLWKEIQDAEDEMAIFTAEQYRALDQMESNVRLIFAGGAGSGKTLLAVEKARRAAFKGKKVLLLCYNRYLGARLRSEVEKLELNPGLIIVESIHRYFSRIIADAGLDGALDRKAASATSAREVYDEDFIELFIKALAKNPFEKFDILIIDEGQDLLSDSYLLALDAVLEGGMEKGEWVVFLDPGAQARLFNRLSLETYSYLKSMGAPEYKLDMNCRNTVQIATQASILSGFPTGTAKVVGPKVEYITYNDDTEEAKLIIDLVKRLVTIEKVPAECITILSPKSRSSMSLFASGAKLPGFIKELDYGNINNPESGVIYIASVQSYKGLENNIIIYTDVDRLDDEWIEGVNYVGMTRPKEKMYVFIHKKLRKKYENRMLKYATHDFGKTE